MADTSGAGSIPAHDVVVVGAGPAGCAAATVLARAGCDVLVVDKARFPRDKCCGDGLTTMALRRLADLGLEPSSVASWQAVERVHLRAPSGRTVDLSLPGGDGGFAAVARRADLDAALVDLARDAGADVRDGVGMHDAVVGERSVAIDLDTGPATARYVIGADGMWSPLRRALGLGDPGYRGEWHAFRRYVHADGPGSRDMWVWFDDDLLPGYAWAFPLPGGRVNLGFGIPRHGARAARRHGDAPAGGLDGAGLARVWRGLADRPHIRAVVGTTDDEGPGRAWPIPARLPRARLTGHRSFLVGDAAAAADPMTGEGIGQALETGVLAAEAIVGPGATSPAAARHRYEHDVRRALQLDHRLAAGLSALLAHRRATELALRAVDSTGWTRRSFARWMFEDEPRAALLTPRRWHRRFLRRPGAPLGPRPVRS